MPKIIIREKDLTSAGVPEYSNFSVVVPGYVNPTTWYESGREAFDANGICEINNDSEFIKKIGIQPTLEETPAEFCSPTHIGKNPKAGTSGADYEATEANGYSRIIEQIEFNSVYQGRVYMVEVSADPAPNKGYLIYHTETGAYFKYTKATSYNSTTKYAVIEPENVGNDAITAAEESDDIGNQLARELVSLGYTVLYKRLAQFEADKDSSSDSYIPPVTDASFWAPLKDKVNYDFRYLLPGNIGDTAEDVRSMVVADLARQRGDCIALLDVQKALYEGKSMAKATKAVIENSYAVNEYTAWFVPAVQYNLLSLHNTTISEGAYYTNNVFPAAFHYLACAKKAFESFNEWYAVAGYTRGIANYTVQGLLANFGEASVAAFEARRTDDTEDTLDDEVAPVGINVILNIKGGYYLWGNRTAKALDANGLVAQHFLNIRQLCSTLKKQIYTTCRQLTFDPNSDILWMNFCGRVKPILEKMKGDQGIKDYALLKVTPTNPEKAKLYVRVRIVPIEAVEDFDIEITLEDSLVAVNG